ncbi:MAG: glycine betaine ABC transporter substrate-binding protein [Nitriliruptoraceae bacterium]
MERYVLKFLRSTRSRWRATTLVGMLAAALVLAACGGDNADEEPDTAAPESEDTEEPEAPEEPADGGNVGEGSTISIGWMPWEEAIAVTNLWTVILEDNGYEVEQEQLDPGIVFDGVASGDLDLFLDAWLPNTHSQYMEQYGNDVEDLGPWLAEAPLTWTVPAYVDEVNSLADLADNADLFDGQIVGIEPGAGLTAISRDEVMPTYGLEDSYELIESSTPAMLSELENAIANEEPILVTLWRPHPAYGQYDLKDLEDPEGALGEPDQIHALARSGFSTDHPEAAAALENFEFTNDQISAMTVAVLSEEGSELENARAWVDANRGIVEAWLEGTGLSLS